MSVIKRMIRPSIKSSLETREQKSFAGFDGLGHGKKWGLLFVSWTLFGLFFASQVLINRAYRGRPLNLGHTLIIWLICAYIWAALSPLILYLSKRLRIERGRLGNLLIHLVASLGFSVIQLGAYIAATSYTNLSTQPFAAVFQESIVTGLYFNLLTYWALVTLSREEVPTFRGKVQKAEIGGYVFSDFPVRLAQAQAGTLSLSELDGVLGNPILKMFNITFDYRRRKMYWEPNQLFSQKVK